MKKVIIVMDADKAGPETNEAADMIIYEDGTVLKERSGYFQPILMQCSLETLIKASRTG